MSTARAGIIALAVGVILVCVPLGVVLLSSGAKQLANNTSPTPNNPLPKNQSSSQSAYPWPECEACVYWLQKHTGDPKSIEIIQWESREVGGPGKHSNVILRFRAKNQFGAMMAERRMFSVLDGKVTSSFPHPVQD